LIFFLVIPKGYYFVAMDYKCKYSSIKLIQTKYPFFSDEYGRSALHYAAINNDVKRLKKNLKLIFQNEDFSYEYKIYFINKPDNKGFLALYYAMFNHYNKIINQLVHFGADINVKYNNGYDSLFYLVLNATNEQVENFLRYVQIEALPETFKYFFCKFIEIAFKINDSKKISFLLKLQIKMLFSIDIITEQTFDETTEEDRNNG
jgi:ankyrin repeat protein